MNILSKLTNRYLKLNKKRTIVTIIGIILSGAMISAVTTLAVTFQKFMVNTQISSGGRWEAIFREVKPENIKYFQNNDKFSEAMMMAPLYLGKNTYSDDEFIRIYGYTKSALENVEGKVVKGRFPENSSEIVLSQSFFDGKENEPEIGDKVTFTIGKIIEYELIETQKEENETFIENGTKTFTVVGIIKRPEFENRKDYYTAGIVLLDEQTLKQAETVDIGVITKEPKKIYEDAKQLAEKLNMYVEKEYKNGDVEKVYQIDYHDSLLAYMGISDNIGFNGMLYSVCGILIIVIIIGSVLVIYNSFAISVSERKKQFGMLSSIGATKKQIRKSVIQEGSILGIIGIPIGIIGGIIGIGITLGVVNELLAPLFTEYEWKLELTVSWQAILLAAILIAITIYLSVVIPAKRASKITPIDAIRQTQDIKVKPKKLKTPKFIRKIFKMPGEIALKNLKRSKKRYRTTVLSLIISIVLFISVSGFVGYMYNGFNALYDTKDYDISVAFNSKDEQLEEKIIDKILKIKDAKRISATKVWYGMIEIPKERIDNNLENLIEEQHLDYLQGYNYCFPVQVITLNEEELDRYIKEIGIKELKENQAIFVNNLELLRMYQIETNVADYKEGEKITITESSNLEEIRKKEIEIAKITNKYPIGLKTGYIQTCIIVSEKTHQEIVKIEEKPSISKQIYIQTDKQENVEEQLNLIQEENVNIDLNVYNIAKELQMEKNVKIVIQIFLYGFITLISAIGIANIFNTISTNIGLRRREFANLKSIGMTDKQFKKMLNLECLFYGTKALLYGIPIGIFICYLLNQGFSNAITFIFTLPWSSIIISVIAVYIVVFITMIYSSKKVKKENIIDVLRDENV